MKIASFTNSSPYSGVGHRAVSMRQQLKIMPDLKITHFNLDGSAALLSKQGRPVRWIKPLPKPLNIKSLNWIRLGNSLQQYIKHTDKLSYDIFHASNQTLSFLSRHFHPFLLTVHDIIEALDPQSRSAYLVNRYLYSGIKKSTHIIAVSNYTKQSLIDNYGISSQKITTIYNGVGDSFFPISDQTLLQQARREFKLPPNRRFLLTVGSDHPRKNFTTTLQVFSRLRNTFPDLALIKVGSPGLPKHRETHLALISKLNLSAHVFFLENLTDKALNLIYNLAIIMLFPSRHEGFGLPPLQSFACGIPVVTSNITSLPEIVANSALTHNPDDIDALHGSVINLLSDQELYNHYRQAGLSRATKFNWQRSAKHLHDIYHKLLKSI